MKRYLLLVTCASLALLITQDTQAAANVLPDEVNEDLYFQRDVFVPAVEIPEDVTSEEDESVGELLGTGSVTIGNQKGGGLPQITIFGGTEIRSERYQGQVANKTWWEGEFNAPYIGQAPNKELVVWDNEDGHKDSTVDVIQTFNLGLENEIFSFSPAARFVFPIEAENDVKVWYAIREDNEDTEEDEWVIDDENYCFEESGYCTLDLEEIGSIAFVYELRDRCPRQEISNGHVSDPPFCKIMCDRGYELNETRTNCVRRGTAEQDLGGEDVFVGEEFAGMTDEEIAARTTNAPQYEYRQGYFRFLRTRDQLERELPAEELEGNEMFTARRMNAATRRTMNDKGNFEDTEKVASGDDDGFLNYLLGVRNSARSQEDAVVYSQGAEGASGANGALTPSQGEAGMHASAPLLPSTGPGIFIALAAIGFGLMVAAARRRN